MRVLIPCLAFVSLASAPASAQWCDSLRGQKVCEPSYWFSHGMCVDEVCRSMGGTPEECAIAGAYTNGYQAGLRDCEAVQREREMCEQGYIDPETFNCVKPEMYAVGFTINGGGSGGGWSMVSRHVSLSGATYDHWTEDFYLQLSGGGGGWNQQ